MFEKVNPKDFNHGVEDARLDPQSLARIQELTEESRMLTEEIRNAINTLADRGKGRPQDFSPEVIHHQDIQSRENRLIEIDIEISKIRNPSIESFDAITS